MVKATVVNIGDTYGRLTIISDFFYKSFPNGSKAKFVECVCECGTERVIRLGSLTNKTNPTRSCGCLQQEAIKNLRESLETGSVFGRLTVLRDLGMIIEGDTPRNSVEVQCECGSEPFITRVTNLKSGNTKSCGCYHKELLSKSSTKHGMSGTTAYSSWQGMKDRCTNPNNPRWERYGGRGITYDPKWETFEGFWEDMNSDWYSGADIDRENFDLHYCKENCRWVDRDVGNHNKSKPLNCTSQYKGVYYDKAKDKWTARLNRNGTIHLQKRFKTELEAAIAYDNCSEEIYGDRPNNTER